MLSQETVALEGGAGCVNFKNRRFGGRGGDCVNSKNRRLGGVTVLTPNAVAFGGGVTELTPKTVTLGRW